VLNLALDELVTVNLDNTVMVDVYVGIVVKLRAVKKWAEQAADRSAGHLRADGKYCGSDGAVVPTAIHGNGFDGFAAAYRNWPGVEHG
jgi:hypothetical protein